MAASPPWPSASPVRPATPRKKSERPSRAPVAARASRGGGRAPRRSRRARVRAGPAPAPSSPGSPRGAGPRAPKPAARAAVAPPRARGRARSRPSASARCGRGRPAPRRMRSKRAARRSARAGRGYRLVPQSASEAIIEPRPAALQGPHGLSRSPPRPSTGLTRAEPLRRIPRMARRRLPVAVLAVLLVAAPAGAGTSPIAKKLAKALAVPHVSAARTGAIAVDLQTGETIFARHDTLSLAPASNEKLAVSYAALVGLGAAHRIETDVVGRGERKGTVWQGSLLLVGHGDPTLSSADLAVLARAVRAAGIRRVTGAVFGDESFFDSRRTVAGWRASFYISQSPPLSALTVDRASYRGHISRNPALSAALAFRDVLRRAGVMVGGG